ncbi:MAG: GNAT family N-acetyltransferase [Bacteroidota bacterium]
MIYVFRIHSAKIISVHAQSHGHIGPWCHTYRLGETPIWSVSCFFVKKEYRRRGLSNELVAGAVTWAQQKKIELLEAYPAIPYAKKVPDSFLWSGVLSAFRKNGFRLVKKNGKTKAMVRLHV